MKILVLNAGSSSLKYKLFIHGEAVTGGAVEKIGESGGVADHHEALGEVENRLAKAGALPSFDALDAVGHRVVHGGERFVEPTLVDSAVMAAIRELIPLAPLHNPANLQGIERMAQRAPNVPQVAVFDTAFHQSMPERAWRYALPERFYERYGIRKYGFHGTSHAYVSEAAARRLGKPLEKTNLITLHLGNGASACAIHQGRSVDTSMGYTPLAGLVMGTRCGDLDPQVAILLEREGHDADFILNHESGLKGLCGVNDMRGILEAADAGDTRSQTAVEVYVHRIRHYVGAYFALAGPIDALVFTGGIGEHSPAIRAAVCRNLAHLGILLDDEKNRQNAPTVSADGAAVQVLVIPTDEERQIAAQTEAVIQARQTLKND